MADLGSPPAASPGGDEGRRAVLSARVEALGKASRHSAVFSGIGLAILFGSLAIAAWRLDRVDAQARDIEARIESKQTVLAEMEVELEKQQAALDSVRRELEDKTEELESKSKQLVDKDEQLDEVQALVARSADPGLRKKVEKVAPLPAEVRPEPSAPPPVPLEAVSRVELAVAPTSKTVGDRPLYDIRFSVRVPEDRLSEILKVEYFFDHPTFVPKTKTSFDAGSGFSLRYYGWGCLTQVKVTLVDKGGERHALPGFDMCASAAWARRNATKL